MNTSPFSIRGNFPCLTSCPVLQSSHVKNRIQATPETITGKQKDHIEFDRSERNIIRFEWEEKVPE